MDLNKVEKVWNEFSEINNAEFEYKERELFDVIQSNYIINYTNELAIFSFIGMLSKSTKGNNTNKTSIIIEYLDKLDVDNFEFQNSGKLESLFVVGETTDLEKNILKSLNKFNGRSITLKNNFVRIDTNTIFSTLDEFQYVLDLTSTLKSLTMS